MYQVKEIFYTLQGEGAQTGDRIVAASLDAPLDRRGQLVEYLQDDGHHDGVAVGEVGVDGRGRDAHLARHGAQGNSLVRAGPVDQGQRSRHDLVRQPGSLAASVPLAPARDWSTRPAVF